MATPKKTPEKKSTAKKSVEKPVTEKKPAAKKASSSKPSTKKSSTKKATPTSPFERYKMIEIAAYYLAEKDGFIGCAADYWIAAEKEIDRKLTS